MNTYTRLTPYRMRRIDQYVIPLPTNGRTFLALVAQMYNDYPGMPAHLVKIKASDAGDEILISVPVDWHRENRDGEAATPMGEQV